MIYDSIISDMKKCVIDLLDELEPRHFVYKTYISKKTEIPEWILTPLLREMKHEGVVFISTIWCENNSTPKGSGYALTSKNPNY
jgi:uncharacterized protein (DUF608 family)